MKIRSIEIVPVNLPFKTYVSDSWGQYESSNHGIVVMEGESGEKGFGEVAFAWFGGAHGLCRDANKYWCERLIGMDTRDIARINEVLDAFCVFSKRNLLVKSGIEMAAWDLLGKELGVSVHTLLGGKLRETIPLTGGIRMAEIPVMVEDAKAGVAAGFRELKLKVGLDDQKDLAALQTIRAAIPDEIAIRVDANMAWKSPKRAKLLMDEMQQYGVRIVEQPLHERDLTGHSWLRQHTDSLILIDEGVWDAADAKDYISAGAADMLHVYTSESGGIDGARRIFDLAACFGMDCTIGSMPEGRIGAAASLQVAAAMRNLSPHPSDIRGFTAYRDDVADRDLPIRDGCLLVPDSPGLGINVDEEKLNRLRVDK